jgi:hypothetical protein
MTERIRVRYSRDGSLPEGVVLASVHERRRGKPGWHAITPGGVAHGPSSWGWAMWLADGWVRDFLRPGQVDEEFCRPHQEAS